MRERLRQARTAGRMDGTSGRAELLDKALAAERRELFPDPDDSARLAEAGWTPCPTTPPAPSGHEGLPLALGRGPAGLREDPGSAAPRGARQLVRLDEVRPFENARGQDLQAVKDMVADLSALIDAHSRGEDTDEQFREFMDKHGQFFPDDPQSVES